MCILKEDNDVYYFLSKYKCHFLTVCDTFLYFKIIVK